MDNHVPVEEDLTKTINFLRALVKTKDEVINRKETEKNYFRTRVGDLEKMLDEKDAYIQKLEQNIDELSQMASDVTSDQDRDPNNLKRKNKKNVRQRKVPAEICNDEDKGRCK